MRLDPTPHVLIPFAACSAAAWLPTLEALPPSTLKRLGQLLQGMRLVETDRQNAESLSPPHERALARALGLATLETPDGLMPWAAQDAATHLQAGDGTAWAWITPCHWAVRHLHATQHQGSAGHQGVHVPTLADAKRRRFGGGCGHVGALWRDFNTLSASAKSSG